MVDCDSDDDCAPGLYCADGRGDELTTYALDSRKAYCGNVGEWNEEVCYDPMKLPLRECEFDCDTDDDCATGLMCADSNKGTLTYLGLDPRKAYCGKVGKWREEVCYDPSKLPTTPLLKDCEVDCDVDSDCAYGLLCADAHKDDLMYAGYDERKAYCGDVGTWKEEVCYNPKKL